MKPIETGCLAIISWSTFPENVGKTIEVGKFAAYTSKWGRCWWGHCSSPIKGTFGVQPSSNFIYPEQHLLRIDGHEETEDEKAELCAS